MRLMRTLAAAFALCLTGCASLYDVTVDSTANNVYGGVRLDSKIIASAATDGNADCGLRKCDRYTVWGLGIPAVLDFPLSLAGDTLLLPYTLTKTP